MNTLLFSAISLVFIGSAAAPVPSAVDTNVASKAECESVEAHSDDVPASASEASADDAEFERLMAAAPDQGDFGDSVITDKTGAEIRVSGFGFSDR